MSTFNALQFFGKRVLVTRDSARELQDIFESSLAEHDDEIAIDFQGIEGVTPSFVDELLHVIEETLSRKHSLSGSRVVFLNPPTRLSAKFAAIGRAHGLPIVEATDGRWIFGMPVAAP